VRFARFEGDVAQRAEEYQVAVSGMGQAYRVRHELPEATPGATLSEDRARELALATIHKDFGVSENDVTEISAEAKKRPARRDWSVEYKDTRNYGLPEGEPRLAVEITGDQIADATRYIHVPEDWQREERSRRNLPDIFGVAMTVLTVGIIISGMIVAVIRWSRNQGFSTGALRWIGGAVLLIGLINIANNWKTTISTLSTAQPYGIQIGLLLTFGLVSAFVIAGALGLVSGFVADKYDRARSVAGTWWMGISLGVLIAGMRAVTVAFAPSLEPLWPDFTAAGAQIPLLSGALNPFSAFIILLLALSLLFEMIHSTTRGWRRRKLGGIFLFLVMGLLLETRSIETIPSWLAGGALLAVTLLVGYVLVVRYVPRVILPMVATLAALSVLRDAAYRAYPGVLAGGLIAVVIIAGAVSLMNRRHIET
jgi:MFS family permease